MSSGTAARFEGLLVRSYGTGDREPIVAMLAASDPWRRLGYDAETWESVLALPLRGRESHVVERAGRPVALALVKPRFLAGDYLEVLAVHEDERGHGIGSRLLAHLEEIAFARGRNVFVCVADFNSRARSFYERHGYREIGPIPDLLSAGSAEILLRKTTGPARA